MKKRNKIAKILLLLLVLLIIIIIFGNQLIQFKYLPFISYHHLATSQEIKDSGYMPEKDVEYNNELKFNYAPNSFLINTILSIIIDKDMKFIYIIFPLFLLLECSLFLFLLLRLNNLEFLMPLIILILATSHLTTFFVINYPETLSLVFLSAILFFTLKEKMNYKNSFLLGILFGANIISHLNPALLSFLLMIPYIFINNDKFFLKIKNGLLIALGSISFIILYPLKLIFNRIFFLKDTFEEKAAMEWVRDQITWTPNYSFNHYLNFIIGHLLFLTLLLAFIYTIKKTFNKKRLLVFNLIFIILILAILSNGLFYYKMISAVLILLFLPISLFLGNLQFHKKIFILLLTIIFILSLINLNVYLSSLGNGFSTSPELYEAVDWIRENTPKDSLIITNIGFEGLISGLGGRNQFGGGSTPYTITKYLNPQEDYHQIVKSQKEDQKSILCDISKRKELIKKNEISYFLYSKIPTYLDTVCKDIDLEKSFDEFSKVYVSNDKNIIIYKLS